MTTWRPHSARIGNGSSPTRTGRPTDGCRGQRVRRAPSPALQQLCWRWLHASALVVAIGLPTSRQRLATDTELARWRSPCHRSTAIEQVRALGTTGYQPDDEP